MIKKSERKIKKLKENDENQNPVVNSEAEKKK